MAKVYLDRIKKRFGWTGGSYRELMKMIVAQNHESASRAVGRIKVGRMKQEAQKLSRRKRQPAQLWVPNLEDVLPKRSVFIRKGADQGELLADTLRDRLTKNLRQAVSEYLKTGEGTMQYKRGQRAGRINPELIDRFQEAVSETFKGYTKSGPGGVPPNVRSIAVTEVRSAIDDVKELFAQRMIDKNPGAQATKTWKHNDHLVKEPREGHKEIDGVTIPMGEKFRVRRLERVNGVLLHTATVLMAHPHDPSADAEDVIGCQCEVDYKFDIPVA